ncbi:ferulic acid esterase A faeA [Metarhizium album ARSEF 1941]|uniref:Ferulic acid esterase A faeA n=1 Tax=Metarhizium album (strain ARSEF 1941) TaxID=1081103 RepID=A0A0B2WUV4_METAS|nr:ferulic acid esterase A faeA [Metarhizium album ARSEF 1941]KHN97404.1 ferulic acid esterase A faeA [Metarhizium album ARSEF 1941]
MLLAIAAAGFFPLLVLAQQPVSPDVFDKITRYTAFAAASYDDHCAKPPFGSRIVTTFNDIATDTQATLFRDDAAKEVIISFRGTSTPKDLDSDLAFGLVPLSAAGTSCSSCKVHEGFQSAFNAISRQVMSAIKSELSSDSRLIVTGHSLGGGIAAIATSSLIGQGIQVAETYTFGEPRNGDAQWAKYIARQIPDSNYYRVTHSNDGVPQIPPTVLGYVHHGPEYFQSRDAGNTARTTFKCGPDAKSCSAGQDFGSNPINRSHLTYSNTIVGSSLFVAACGAVFP